MRTAKVSIRYQDLLCDANLLRLTTSAAPEPGQKEIFTSWALFILIVLLIIALFTSYILHTRKIQAVHETVLSIFAGTIGTS